MIQCNCLHLPEMSTAVYDTLYAHASQVRRERAAKCLRQEDGIRILAAEALLRDLLKKHLGDGDYPVRPGPGGKPELVGCRDFCFNLSHSGQWVVLAYDTQPVGVDVEQVSKTARLRDLAVRFFTIEEQQYAAASPEHFFRIWTAKESYLKYLGTGLTRPLSSFSVLSPEPGVVFHHSVLERETVLCVCGSSEAAAPSFVSLDTILETSQTR